MQSKFKLHKSRVKEWKSLGFWGGGILCSKMEMLNFKLFWWLLLSWIPLIWVIEAYQFDQLPESNNTPLFPAIVWKQQK